MARKKVRKLLYVEWIDSHSTAEGTWHTRGEICNKPAHSKSIGWILKESKRAITLVSSLGGQEEFAGDITIPKGNIIKRKRIKT